ncbi:PRC and DUF2382 domain-containing protein [Microbacterium sp. zg-YB36]|uniref:PRC and DUF2382 domain-containing protein n=1 Tax=Microbacterium sp. zg-YB36 TaxID=2969407 RepID=UPI00214BA129|nr:PRC and DUF2382 domain-containing protein [Microbacterium sp. zg-YB36]MDL5352339.1 PRC and DUF2382 domain-containing protein [Microbacterium sp. zg-YB36]
MISAHNIASLVGRHVVDVEGKKVGSVGQVFVDPRTGRPNWVTVKTGLFGTSETFVPLDQADEVDGNLRVPFTKDAVKDAPRFESDGELSRSQEDELYAYYADHEPRRDDVRDGGENDDPDATQPHAQDAGTQTAQSAQTAQTGTMRLRKYVVTEEATVTVPVTREEVRVEWVGEAEEASAPEENTTPTDR